VRLSTTSIDCIGLNFLQSTSSTSVMIAVVLPTPVPPFKTRNVLISDRSVFYTKLIMSCLANSFTYSCSLIFITPPKIRVIFPTINLPQFLRFVKYLFIKKISGKAAYSYVATTFISTISSLLVLYVSTKSMYRYIVISNRSGRPVACAAI